MSSTAVAITVTVPLTLLAASGFVIVTVGAAVSFATVTMTAAAVVSWPAASRATAVSVCSPFSALAVFQGNSYGAVVCGTSAGAAALTETTLAGGEVDEDGNEVEMYIGPGLGLLCFGALIDTHFAQRRRLHRLFVAIAGYPQLLGLGIDEDTGLVVHGSIGEVVGKGGVTFVDGRDTVRFDNASQVKKGGELTLSHLRVGLVGTGQLFDLEARELVRLVSSETVVRAGNGEVGTRNRERGTGAAR